MKKLLALLLLVPSAAGAQVIQQQFALVTQPPAACAVLAAANVIPNPLTLPNGQSVSGAGVGYVSPDGRYKVVAIPPFAVPGGQIATGPPNYTFNAQCTITSVAYDITPAPLNTVPWSVFLQRWQLGEYMALRKAMQDAIAAGGTGLAQQMTKQWEQAAAFGSVDLNTPEAQTFKTNLVNAGILTQNRANAIFQ